MKQLFLIVGTSLNLAKILWAVVDIIIQEKYDFVLFVVWRKTIKILLKNAQSIRFEITNCILHCRYMSHKKPNEMKFMNDGYIKKIIWYDFFLWIR